MVHCRIIDRNPIEGVARIFNSAVVPFEGKFIGVFRGEQCNGVSMVSESPDMMYWGKHRHVMGRSSEWWESLNLYERAVGA